MKPLVPEVCARFHQAVELIGGRWTGAVIQTLLHGSARFATIRASIPDISDRMLSDRLRVLEAEGVVERRVYAETPVRIEYRLTEKGRSLDKALAAIGHWAEHWIEVPARETANENEAAGSPATRTAEVRVLTGKPRIKPRAAI